VVIYGEAEPEPSSIDSSLLYSRMLTSIIVFWDTFEFIFIYFFFVETRRRTLEELTEIFRAPKPVKASLTQTQVIVHGDEGVTEVLEKNNVA
jgi:hypothetical protein